MVQVSGEGDRDHGLSLGDLGVVVMLRWSTSIGAKFLDGNFVLTDRMP